MKTPVVYKNQMAQYLLILILSTLCFAQNPAYSLEHQKAVNSPSLHQDQIVILIHGLMRSTLSMHSLKSYLEHQGYLVYAYGYPSYKYNIRQHGVYLNAFIKNVLDTNADAKIHFVTHSLGGIITREALASMTKDQLKNIGSLIMLAPPNKGSLLAKISTTLFPFIPYVIKPLGELSSDKSSYVHRVPIPNIKMGIIAGRFDAKVPPSSARLKGQIETVVIDSTHTFIMNNSRTRQLIVHFLEKGRFEE